MRQQVRIIAHRNKSGNLSLRLRCLLGTSYCDIATGIVLHPAEWDNRRQRVLPQHPDHNALNAQLNTLHNRATEYLQRNPDSDTDAFRTALSDENKHADTYTSDDLFDALNAFIAAESKHNTWSDGTTKRFRSLYAALSAFAPVLHLSTLTAATLDKFIAFRIGQGTTNTTIAKDIKLLRWFLRWCADNGRYNGNLHTAYTPHLKGSNYEQKAVIYLTIEELRRMETTELPVYLAHVRDVFVFCCYTGLRFSDAANLQPSDVHDNYIEIVMQKTDKRIKVELNDHAATILQRYNGTLPALSNQYTNRLLKAIGELCSIDEPTHVVSYNGNRRIEKTLPKYELLTTHCARRTFVVTALQLGIPAEVIMRWTGHSDFAAMKPYIAIVDELKARSMALFNAL